MELTKMESIGTIYLEGIRNFKRCVMIVCFSGCPKDQSMVALQASATCRWLGIHQNHMTVHLADRSHVNVQLFNCGRWLLPDYNFLFCHCLPFDIQMLPSILQLLLQISLSAYTSHVSAKSTFQNHANITSLTCSDPSFMSDNGEFKGFEWKFRYKPNVWTSLSFILQSSSSLDR